MKLVVSFLKDLERNNNREWFSKNKPQYEEARQEIAELTSSVLKGISLFDPSLQGLEVKECLFRIYRDVRFSLNKLPYKNNMGAWMAAGGKKSPGAGYYLHIQPGASFIAAGVWMPEAATLNAIRQEIYFNHSVLRKILQEKEFKQLFPVLDDHQLKTNPKGFDKEHPAIDLLKYKSYVVSHPLSDKDVVSKELESSILHALKTASPLVHFINEAIQLSSPEN